MQAGLLCGPSELESLEALPVWQFLERTPTIIRFYIHLSPSYTLWGLDFNKPWGNYHQRKIPNSDEHLQDDHSPTIGNVIWTWQPSTWDAHMLKEGGWLLMQKKSLSKTVQEVYSAHIRKQYMGVTSPWSLFLDSPQNARGFSRKRQRKWTYGWASRMGKRRTVAPVCSHGLSACECRSLKVLSPTSRCQQLTALSHSLHPCSYPINHVPNWNNRFLPKVLAIPVLGESVSIDKEVILIAGTLCQCRETYCVVSCMC